MSEVAWLQLLLTGAPVAALNRLRDRLVRDGTAPAEVDRQARAALELRALLAERRQRAAELAALNDIAGRLAGLHETPELLREVVAQAQRLLGVDLAYIGLVRGTDFVMEVASGARTAQLLGLRFGRGEGIAGAVVSTGQPRWTSDYVNERSFEHNPGTDAVAEAEGIRALLGVPLTVRGQVLGALFACKRQERHFTDEEVALLGALAAHAAVALDNAATLGRLNAANAELADALGWYRRLTQVVLRGGDAEDLLAEVRAAASGAVALAEPGRPGVAVTAGRVPLGTLVLTGGTAEDRVLLERAAPVLALALLRERAVAQANRVTRDALLLDLLTRAEPDPAAQRRRLRALGLDPAAGYCVLVATPATELALPPGALAAVDGDRLVAVAAVDSPSELLGHTGVTAGAAGPGPLTDSYREASQTLDALLTLDRVGESSTAAELGLYRILLQHTGREELRAQYERALGPVLAQEARRPLLRTLRAYLDHGRRPGPTARALGVHVNTLYQRLDHLDRLLGRDWRDHPRALDLHVLVRLRPVS
ncbi:hypothetical protein JOF53_000639 [Crossiella equi]|uniref:GAF domain-containing protein n=1 Tax=Crossiella equi TaxID=130796 RepID=A0ABS5A6A9_9PSEU|nr:GAF domain-containing protein [Crossiella equi]MBP2471767.1 hypothetical protein [Crossiella equi]